jgi:16S rRNA (adenine1518-N6/adenine1519-N6)-dimethyltransferase
MRGILRRHGFHFSKGLGQNFLTDDQIPERIAESAGLDQSCGVLEIGPGFGALTQALCARAGKVVALELDAKLLPVLDETVGRLPNLTVLQGDAARADYPALAETHLGGLVPHVVANLPYSVTSPVLRRLLDAGVFRRVTVMVQREVARRICAAPGGAAYGAFTVYCGVKAAPEILFDVPPDCFFPRPKVFSSVLRLTPHESPPVPAGEQTFFFRVTRAAFAQRRKTLRNALRAAFPQDDVDNALRRTELDPQLRGETLDIDAFLRLSRNLREVVEHG